jgi:integrase
MASIRKHKHSPYWIASFTKPNGKRTTRSTRIPVNAPTAEQRKENKEKALEVAQKWERTGRRAKHSGMTNDQAREVVNDILRSAGVEEIGAVTTRAFFKDWLQGKNNEGTHDRYDYVADLFLTHLGDLADQSLEKVTYKHMLSFIELRRKSGAAPKTISVDLKALGNAFNLAFKLTHTKANPVVQALALQPIAVVSSVKGVFTPTQIAQLVITAMGDWRTVTLLGYYTAARLRDCCNLKVSQIDWVNQIITVRQTKTGKPAWIPIHPCLARHLEKVLKGKSPGDYVCPSLANRKTGGKTGLSKDFAKIMRDAKIDPGLIPGKGKRRFSTLSFHSLRHSFNSHLANLGVDQETRQIMTGHATKAANDDYTHLELPKLRGAVGLLPDVYTDADPDKDGAGADAQPGSSPAATPEKLAA